jgi:uncharacterized protein (TIGR00730 family)
MKTICVYCGSSSGKNPEYRKAARALATAMVARDIGLVYGGADVGLMGEIANEVLAHGGRVTGIIPQSLIDKEVSHQGLTRLHIVDSMHARKALMAELSDGFIALPGGLGTLEELFEVLTWSQLGFHNKPCGLLNIKQYYDGLAQFLDHAMQEEFIKPSHRDMLINAHSPSQLLDQMANYEPPQVTKWISHDDL